MHCGGNLNEKVEKTENTGAFQNRLFSEQRQILIDTCVFVNNFFFNFVISNTELYIRKQCTMNEYDDILYGNKLTHEKTVTNTDTAIGTWRDKVIDMRHQRELCNESLRFSIIILYIK